MRWSLGPFFVGYAVENIPGRGFWCGLSRDGHRLVALCFKSFAIGGGVAVGPRSPWQRKKDKRSGAVRFKQMTADQRSRSYGVNSKSQRGPKP